ncbi:Elongation factor P--(R)-beta-lysine ligase [Polystyrenella longa]|uniref:Elongation factor P--(R)-beta-lysine ligase n=1 Tax=Polystyrenella longa TaxID=2528007 RepID=A0A518CJE4_9PLAN|nr:EF-P lysine aminoacylase EpmA [Polystyrenella longa]QDU79327.1 Elongation factor P--(R)-beta-lysine ligase [Polystyrenella longa]
MNSPAPSWRSTATISDLKIRAGLVRTLRLFFEETGYWEVQTPVLSREAIIDAHINPLRLTDSSIAGDRYLQTSPEAHMKRLLSAGADRIYQFSSVFRQQEQGDRHNTEFTLLEWYSCNEDHHDQMKLVESLIRTVAEKCPTKSPLDPQLFERLTYAAAFERYMGTSVVRLTASELKQLAIDQQVSIPPGLDEQDRDGWLNLLLAEKVEPQLGIEHPVFLIDYPESQAALARVRRDDPPVAERFELYIKGIELCNGYHEETNAEELRTRFERQNEIRRAEGMCELPLPELFLEATEAGYPASAGVALGVERLLMWLMKKATLPEVVAFPYERA